MKTDLVIIRLIMSREAATKVTQDDAFAGYPCTFAFPAGEDYEGEFQPVKNVLDRRRKRDAQVEALAARMEHGVPTAEMGRQMASEIRRLFPKLKEEFAE